MARTPKLSPDVQARICEAVRAGNYLEIAAAYGGVAEATFHRWMARGAKETCGPYRAFRTAIEKASHDAEVALVASWRKQAKDNWQAAASLLERRFSRRWARRHTIEAVVQEELRVALDRLRGVLDAPNFRKVVDTLADAGSGERDPSGVGG